MVVARRVVGAAARAAVVVGGVVPAVIGGEGAGPAVVTGVASGTVHADDDTVLDADVGPVASSRTRTRSRTAPSSSSTSTCTRWVPRRKSTSTSRPAGCSTSTDQPSAGTALTSASWPPASDTVTVPAPAASTTRVPAPGAAAGSVAAVVLVVELSSCWRCDETSDSAGAGPSPVTRATPMVAVTRPAARPTREAVRGRCMAGSSRGGVVDVSHRAAPAPNDASPAA